jgi:chromosome condensin MukBEF complex kleisin-like MukF subunit
MSETPRTDAEAFQAICEDSQLKGECVEAAFASKLERELNESLALLRELNDALLPIPDALQARLDAILDVSDAAKEKE